MTLAVAISSSSGTYSSRSASGFAKMPVLALPFCSDVRRLRENNLFCQGAAMRPYRENTHHWRTQSV